MVCSKGEPRRPVHVAQRILDKLQIEVPSPKGVIHVGCTVGIAVCPVDATDAHGLLALADRLIYVGKKSGRNRVVTVSELEGAEQQPLSYGTFGR